MATVSHQGRPCALLMHAVLQEQQDYRPTLLMSI